jgi:MraZ protein
MAQYGEALVVVPNEHSLEVHPLEEWQRMEEKLNTQSAFAREVREISRLYISRARDVVLDGAGRILLPPDTRKQAGLEKDVTLVGGGRRMFEVWDRQRFDEYERTQGDALPTLFEKLAALGV